jgi:Zn-dependent protease with chaperone function
MEQFDKSFVIFAALVYVAALLVDRAVRKARLESMFGSTASAAFFPIGGIEDFSFRVVSVGWLVFKMIEDFALRPVVHLNAHWSLAWRDVYLGTFVAIPLAFVALIFFWWRGRPKKVFQLSRGQLFETVRRMTDEIAPMGLMEVPIYVVPEPDCAKTCSRLSRGVVLPLPLLDLLNRNEIDAVIARQLVLQVKGRLGWRVWAFLASNVAVVATVSLLNLGMAISDLLYAFFLTAEIYFLFRILPRLLMEADVRAIRLTGDPESFLSALRGLEKFGGKPLEPEVLREISSRSTESANRIMDYHSEFATLMPDRYPTSGSYLETGF